jgi:hypothetical protein
MYCLINDGSWKGYIIYSIGNLFVASNLILIKYAGKENICRNTYILIAYMLCGYLSMNIGRTLISLIFSLDFTNQFLRYIFSDALNAVIGLIIILIARKQDGIFEDQMAYLKRQNEGGKK